MSILVAVSELQERVRTGCALPVFTSDTAITAALSLDHIKRAAQKLAGAIQQSGADEQYLTLSTDVLTVANIPVVSLPTNTLDVVRLAVVDGDHETQLSVAPLDSWNPDNTWWANDTTPYYRVMGNTITLFPTPVAVRTLRLFYTVGFTVNATSDILALRPNWDEYIVAYASILARECLKEDASGYRDLLAMAREEIVGQLKRDRGGIRQVRDVREPVFGGRWSRLR